MTICSKTVLICDMVTFVNVLGWLPGCTRGLAKPTILLVDNSGDAMQPHTGLVATLTGLLTAAPKDCLRLLVTSRVPVPVEGGACSFSLEPLSVEEAAALVLALEPDLSAKDAEALAAHCGCIPAKIRLLANAINGGAMSVSSLLRKDPLVAALEAAPAEVRATVEALTVFPNAFDEEHAADVLTGVVGAGAGSSSDADAAAVACEKLLAAAVKAGLLLHDPRSDTYNMQLLVRDADLAGALGMAWPRERERRGSVYEEAPSSRLAPRGPGRYYSLSRHAMPFKSMYEVWFKMRVDDVASTNCVDPRSGRKAAAGGVARVSHSHRTSPAVGGADVRHQGSEHGGARSVRRGEGCAAHHAGRG